MGKTTQTVKPTPWCHPPYHRCTLSTQYSALSTRGRITSKIAGVRFLPPLFRIHRRLSVDGLYTQLPIEVSSSACLSLLLQTASNLYNFFQTRFPNTRCIAINKPKAGYLAAKL